MKNRSIITILLLVCLTSCTNTPSSSTSSSLDVSSSSILSSSTSSSTSIPASSYSITYDLDGGVVTKGNPSSYTNETDDFTLNKAYKQGYIFTGWKDDNNVTTLNRIITKGTSGNLHFIAQYKVDSKSHNGEEIDVKAQGMDYFLLLEDGETADYLKNYDYSSSISTNKGVVLAWTNINSADEMTLTVATDSSFTNVIYTTTTSLKKETIYNLLPNQLYYAKVVDDTGDLIYLDTFKLEGRLRTIYFDDTVVNARDIGGWTIDDNSTIPYGRIYRTSDLQVITESGKKYLQDLNIKTEIDLRLTDQGTKAPIEGMNFINAGFWHWEHCFPDLGGDATSINGLSNAMKAFADESNYPIIAHCSGGADRTSTLFFVIEGLLGMSYEDMARDHELTSFSGKGMRLRCGTTLNTETGKYEYDIESTEKDKSGFIPSFDKVYQHVLSTYGSSGWTFKQSIEKYCKDVLGLTQSQIDNIRNNILNK